MHRIGTHYLHIILKDITSGYNVVSSRFCLQRVLQNINL